MPLHRIGDDDLRDRVVSGEAAVCTVWRTQRHDEGGDVIEISRYGLPRGERDRYGRGRHLRPCSAGRPATKAPAASAGHDQVLRSEEHTSELQSRLHLVCRLLLEK